jgi:hypothetical protein
LLSETRIALIQNGTVKEYVEGSDFDKYILLKKVNAKEYEYASIPLMIDLSISLNEDYNLFLEGFKQNFEVNDELSSFAIFRLSEYATSNFDFVTARRLASLAFRYKANPNLSDLLKNNISKTEWFVKNAEKVLNEINHLSN